QSSSRWPRLLLPGVKLLTRFMPGPASRRSAGDDPPLGQPVRPSLSAMQYGDDLNDVTLEPVGYDVRCAGDDKFACVGDATRPTEGGRCRQARHRCSNSLDHAARRAWVVGGDALANVFKPTEIAGSVFEATKLTSTATAGYTAPQPFSRIALRPSRVRRAR